MAYNTGFGSANEVLGGSRFVELAPVGGGRAFHEVDTTPFRMPDLLPNPVCNWFENPLITHDLDPVMIPTRIAPERPIPYPVMNIEPFHVRDDLARVITKIGRYSDDF